ncbi:MAG: hypothetical protein OXC65_04795 [Thiotrichales bacterium]|nr:hypothetical protein [Thiotrichales bacterium]
MMKARTSLWASLAIAASLGLAGCGGSNDNGDGDDGAQGPTPEEQVAAANKSAEDAAAAQKKAEDDFAAANQAAARTEAMRRAETIDYSVQVIGTKQTLTKEFVGTSANKTLTVRADGGTGSERDIPALKPDKDDKTMYSATSSGDTYTARVYTTAMDKTGQSFATNLPGAAIANFPGQTRLGYYQGGRFTFHVSATGRDLTSLTATTSAPTHASIKADDFPTSSGEKTYKVDERVFEGSLGGIDGTYACDGSGCAAELIDGDVALTGGSWTFKPDDETAGVTVADTAYLSYGWWQVENSADVWRVGPVLFSDGGGANTLTTVQRQHLEDSGNSNASVLQGTATYKRAKGAAGHYAVYDPAGHSEAGHFTADAMLTATFGDTGSRDSDGNSAPHYVSGSIDNFTTMSGGEETDSGKDWKVALGKGTLEESNTSGADDDDRFKGSTTWSIGDDKWGTTGDYWAHLYTTDRGAAAATVLQTDEDLDKSPDEISGTFRAHHGRHRMLGAFAATLSTADDPAPAAAAQ